MQETLAGVYSDLAALQLRAVRLPEAQSAIYEALPKIAGEETSIVMHNDAVVQGLSEVPFMTEGEHWGVLTIGTGLGNARFTNRKSAPR